MGRSRGNCRRAVIKNASNRGCQGSQLPWSDTLISAYDDYKEIAASWEVIEGHGDEATASKGPRQADKIFRGVG